MNKKSIIKNILLIIIIPLLLEIFINIKISLIFLSLIIVIKIIKIKKRGYLIIDKSGKKVKTKEFFKRWKKGIEGITPLQQAKTNVWGTWIIITGIISGIVINALVRLTNQWWWIEVILIGSLIVTTMQIIGSIQKYWRFKEIDKVQKELEK